MDLDGLNPATFMDRHVVVTENGSFEVLAVTNADNDATTLDVTYEFTPDAMFSGLSTVNMEMTDDQGFVSTLDFTFDIKDYNEPTPAVVNLLDKTYQGLTWNDDTLVVNDLNQDGISDYTASFSQLIALEDDTLEFSISSPTDPEMTALDYFDNQPTVHTKTRWSSRSTESKRNGNSSPPRTAPCTSVRSTILTVGTQPVMRLSICMRVRT